MSEEQIRDRLSYILPGEELGRVKYLKIVNNDILYITLDVHKWSRDKVASVLRKIVVLEREPLCISVIHGYTHGTKIKEMLCADFRNERMVHRRGYNENPGMTLLSFRAA